MSWSWTCLPCNVTGTGPAPASHAHVLGDAFERRHSFWIRRLQWALRGETEEQIAARLNRPIARAELVELLGERWAA